MQHATFGAWEFFFSLCCQDRLLVILMISIQYSEPVNSSFATMKKTKLISRRLLPQDLKTPPKTSSEGLKIRRVPSVSALGWMDIDYFVILSSSILTTGLARASTVLTQATGRLYLHLPRFGITLLATVFLLFFNSCLDYRSVPLYFSPNDLCTGARPRHVGGGPQQETDHPSDPFTSGVFSLDWN